ncbi:ArnT family glycosyltransferase [Segetibacter koreensis]|uniref:ArnT family glycosyltransferase n=1 Tax=Segetibacter koreensis TaxID=398037 RepID=UPI0012F80F47|nr:glycosyltransferase family 39 protein [Segetibacter koreensis]
MLRLIVASTVELGNDEAYYWTYAQHLQWNYFDHPPMVGWLIRLTTANLLLHTELFVRLGAVISSAICTFLIYKIATVIKDSQAGWYAALLYTASIYSSIIAGTFILPDSPQMVFWLLSILLLVQIVKLPIDDLYNQKLWLLFGLTAGLCIMCKLHGIFIWLGVAVYAVGFNKSWLRNKNIYLSIAITLIIISPIIIWNIQNNFVTYSYHGSRVSLSGSAIHIDGFARELAGEIFYNNPINFFYAISTIWWIWKGNLTSYRNENRLLLCCSLPLIGMLLIISLFKDTLPHWSGPAYSNLVIFSAIRLTSVSASGKILKSSLTFIVIISLLGILIINFFPGTLSPEKSGEKIGDGDPTLEMYGWKHAAVLIDSVYKRDTSENIMPRNASIIVNKWFPAAHIDFYIATLTRQQTYAIGKLFDLHQYHWLNQYKRPLKQGDAAYFIIPSNLYKQEDITQLKEDFSSISSPLAIPIYRSGVVCKTYFIFRLKGYHLNNGYSH